MLPDVNYSNRLDDSYCTEMQKAALLTVCMPYIHFKSTNLHFTVWDIDWKRLDMIHSYTFTSGLTKNEQKQNITTSLWNRKEK